jgi:hypothetical protein
MPILLNVFNLPDEATTRTLAGGLVSEHLAADVNARRPAGWSISGGGK